MSTMIMPSMVLKNSSAIEGGGQKGEAETLRVLWVTDHFVWTFRILIVTRVPALTRTAEDEALYEKLIAEAFSIKKNLRCHQRLKLEKEIDHGELTISDVDPLLNEYLPLTSAYRLKYDEQRAQAYACAHWLAERSPMIFDRECRGVLITQAVDLFGMSIPTVRKKLAIYWRSGGNPDAMYPRFHDCGSPGREHRSKTSVEEREAIAAHFLLKVPQEGLTEGYENLVEKRYTSRRNPKKLPFITRPPVPKWIYSYHGHKAINDNLEQYLKKKFGYHYFKNNYAPKLGSLTHSVPGVGYRYQLDATIVDVYLRSELDERLIIGRPILYILVDVYSHALVGFHVALSGPRWVDGANLALLNACTSSYQTCQDLESLDLISYYLDVDPVEETFPCGGLPEEVVGDAMLSCQNAETISDITTAVTVTPALLAYAKGLVEFMFHLSNEKLIKWIPGELVKRLREVERRGRRGRYRWDSCFTLREFRQLFSCFVWRHNNLWRMNNYKLTAAMRRDGVEPYPMQIHAWSVANGVGIFKQFPQDLLEIYLRPRSKASITKEGLIFNDIYYRPRNDESNNWLIQAAMEGREKVEVAYHPTHIQTVDVIKLDERKVIPFDYNDEKQDTDYLNYPLEELLLVKAADKLQEKQDKDERLQDNLLMKNMVGEMAKKSKRRQREALQNGCPMTKQQILAIEANRAQEVAAGADRPGLGKPDSTKAPSVSTEIQDTLNQGSKLASMAQFASIVINDDDKE